MGIFDYFRDLWIVFKESFFIDYNKTKFILSQNKEKLSVIYKKDDVNIVHNKETKSYNLHFLIILVLLFSFLSIASIFLLDANFPKISYIDGHMIGNNTLINHSGIIFIADNSYMSKDFNLFNLSNASFNTDLAMSYNELIQINSNNISNFNITNTNISKTIEDYFKNNISFIVLMGDDFISYFLNSGTKDLFNLQFSIIKVKNLELKSLINYVLFFVFFLGYIFIFLFNVLYSCILIQIYKWITKINIDFIKIFKISAYSFIPASLINILLLFIFGINIYILLIMFIFILVSVNKYKNTEVRYF